MADEKDVIYQLISDLTVDTAKAIENLEKFEQVFDKIANKVEAFEKQLKSAFGLTGLAQQIKNVNNAIDNVVNASGRKGKNLSPEEQAERALKAREQAALRYEQKFSKYYNGLYGIIGDKEARGKLADAATQSAEGLKRYNEILENHKEEKKLQDQFNASLKETEKFEKQIAKNKAEAIRQDEIAKNEAIRSQKRDIGEQTSYWSKKRSLMNLGMSDEESSRLARGYGKEVSVEQYNRAVIAQKELNEEKRRQIQLEKQAEREALRTAKALEKQKTTVSGLLNDIFNIRNSLIFLTVRDLAGGMIDTTNKIQGIRATFLALKNNAADASKEINWIFEASNRYGQISLDAAQNYARFYAAAKDIMPIQNIRYIYDSMMMVSQVLHMTPESFQMMSLAIEQMASKGKVASEELRRQLGQHLPGAIALAAKAMGVTQAKLLDMIKNGQVQAGKFLPLFAQEIRKQYEGGMKAAMESSMVALNRMQNAWNKLKITMGDSGFIRGLTVFATSMMQAMQSKPVMMFAEGIGKLSYEMAKLMPEIMIFGSIFAGKALIKYISKLWFIEKFLNHAGYSVSMMKLGLRSAATAAEKLNVILAGTDMLIGGWVNVVLTALIIAFTKLYKISVGFKNIIDSAGSLIVTLFQGIGTWIGDIFKLASDNNPFKDWKETLKWIDHQMFMLGERIKQVNHKQNVYDLSYLDPKRRTPDQLGYALQKVYSHNMSTNIGNVNINNNITGTGNPVQTASQAARRTIQGFREVVMPDAQLMRLNLGR